MPKYRIIKQTKDEIELELIENIQEIPAKKLEWHNETKEMNWDEAQKYAKKLGNGWRLPTVVELLQAYYDEVEGFEEDDYWSSTTLPSHTSFALSVNVNYGDTDTSSKTNSCSVRCVREI